MASYLDRTPVFNQYVQQLPVDAMVKVGLQRQQQYEQGLEKIQSTIDNVAGLDIMRDVDKNYLQSKLNTLGNNLKYVAAGDFSNFQLVNSVNGMTKQISKDKNVLNAVSATATAKRELSLMEKEREKGTLNPSNEYVFKQQLNNWVSNEEVGQSFNGKYDPSFDVFKFTKETFDAVKPDNFSFDQIYQLGANGKPMQDAKGNLIYSPTMTRMEKEGIFPAKVKETLSQIFSDPRVSKQLSIDGRYTYRNMDPTILSQKVIRQKESVLSSYENQLQELNLQKSMGKNVQKDIDNLTAQMTSVNASYDEYASLANVDPETVRGLLYKDDVNSRYTTMFGQVKDKSQILENPGWNQNWKMQTEANEQSRFAQTLRQQKIAHADDMQYKYTALAQQNELTRLSIKAKGIGKVLGDGSSSDIAGPGGEPTEQAAQSADIEVIRVQTADFEKAANDYSNKSDGFIWETVFSKIPSNDITLKKLTDKGMNRNEAISLMINNGAKKAGQSPEEYKAYWSDKATVEYHKLTPEQRVANPIVSDTYQQYKNSKRIFDSQLTVKSKIDNQTKAELGEVGKKIEMLDFKPQTITYKDKSYILNKQDMLDLAIYKKGNLSFMQSVFGGQDTKALETDSKMALSRLTQRGKGQLAEAYLNDNENVSVDSNGRATKATGGFFEGITNLPNVIRYSSERNPNRDWYQVHKVEGIINNQQYTDGIKKKADIIKQHYNIAPNRNIGVLTGDLETDRGTLSKLKRWGSEAGIGAGNLSPDYKDFVKNLKDNPTENNLGARTIMDGNNEPMVEVVLYKGTERTGGITLQPDQASKLGINLGTLYESKETSAVRNKINFNNNQTSIQNPSEISTYISGDSYYDNDDFPGMKNNTNLDVQANIVFNNGKYYPYIYVNNGKPNKPVQLNGDENLENLLNSLKTVITPNFVQGLLPKSK